MRYFKLAALLAILTVILFSGLKPEPIPQAFDQQDKLHHLLGFAAFAFALRMAFPRLPMVWGLTIGLGLGLAIEWVQAFQPHRSASWGDMLANGLGALCGWALWAVLGLVRRRSPALTAAAEVAPSKG